MKKYQLYRKASNSPSPGHDEYLVKEGTIEQCFEEYMKRSDSKSVSGKWGDQAREEFAKTGADYFYTGKGRLFYRLREKEHMDVLIQFNGDSSVGVGPYSYTMQIPRMSGDEYRQEVRDMIERLYSNLDGEFTPNVIFEDETIYN